MLIKQFFFYHSAKNWGVGKYCPLCPYSSNGPVTLPTSLNKKREKKVLMGMHILKYDTYFWYFLSDFYPILLYEVDILS